MQPFTIEEIAQMVHGVWKNPRPGMAPISAVCTDSRSIIPGSLFLPWVGERFDGHRFIDAALEAAQPGAYAPRRRKICVRTNFTSR